MHKKLLILFVLIALTVVIFSCSEDNGTAPVSFNTPNLYTGQYRIILHWFQPDSQVLFDYITIDFRNDGTYYMKFDSLRDSDQAICNSIGTFRFNGDSLTLDATTVNPNAEICNDQVAEGAKLNYIVEGNTIIFEDRDTAVYRLIELQGI